MDVNLVMEESLPIKLKRRHKHNDSELSIDAITSNFDPAKKYHIEMTNRIVDTIVSNIEWRFNRSVRSSLYAELSILHHRNFDQVPWGTMEELSKHLLLFDNDIIAQQVQTELQSFRELWTTLK